jgi:hypothetical protein
MFFITVSGKIIVAGGLNYISEYWGAPPSLTTIQVIDVLNPDNTCDNLPNFPFPFKSKYYFFGFSN